VDASFFAANLAKVAEGGYVPLVLAALVYGVMYIWHLGAAAVFARLQEQTVPVDAFMAQIAEGHVPRVPGTAVFLTRTQRDAPPVMVWHLKHNRALQERLFVLTVITESVPWVSSSQRLMVQELAPGFWRASAHFGFMERPDIRALLPQAHERGCTIDLSDVTYYVGHETVGHCQVNGIWVAFGVLPCRRQQTGQAEDKSMAEAGDTDSSSLARRLNLTIPLHRTHPRIRPRPTGARVLSSHRRPSVGPATPAQAPATSRGVRRGAPLSRTPCSARSTGTPLSKSGSPRPSWS
jgi:hypothetical protein